MKNVRRVLSLLLLCSLLLALTACGGGLEKKVIGEWTPLADDGYIKIFSNGTADVDGREYEWKVISGDNLVFTKDEKTLKVKVTSISSERMTWETEDSILELIKAG